MSAKRPQKTIVRKPILSKAVRDLRKAAKTIASVRQRLTDYREYLSVINVDEHSRLRKHPDHKSIRHELEKADEELSEECGLLFSEGLVGNVFIELN